MKRLWVLVLVICLLSACQPQPQDAVNAYLAGWQNQDVETVLANVTDDMTLVIDGNPAFYTELTGKEELQVYLEENFAGGVQVEMLGKPEANGDQIVWASRFGLDAFREMGVEWLAGSDTYTVTDGKVSSFVWKINDEDLNTLLEAFATLPNLANDLVGTWRWEPEDSSIGPVEFRYHENGTYELLRTIVDSEILWDVGDYVVEGNTVTLTTSEANYCGVGESGVYEMVVGEDGLLESVLIEDACFRRKPPIEEPVYLSPYSS